MANFRLRLAPKERSRYKASMPHTLLPHPEFPASAVSALTANASRDSDGRLRLAYQLSGDAKRLIPPPAIAPNGHRADELWLATCFEAFVRPKGGSAYWEFNVTPAFDWQVYALSGYREGRHPASSIAPPIATAQVTEDGYGLEVVWSLKGIVPQECAWDVGLTAVILDDATSYWALRHAPEKPDFHYPQAFILELPVAP